MESHTNQGDEMKTSLSKIVELRPSLQDWETLIKHLGRTQKDVINDEPIPLLAVLEANGFMFALECLKVARISEKEKALLSAALARESQRLLSDEINSYINSDINSDIEKQAANLAIACIDTICRLRIAVAEKNPYEVAEATLRAVDDFLELADANGKAIASLLQKKHQEQEQIFRKFLEEHK